MVQAGTTRPPSLRFAALLWAPATLGAAAVAASVLVQIAPTTPLPAPLWLLVVASTVQSGLIIALAVWAGVAFAHQVGLRAPAFEAAAAGRPIAPALAPQLLPGLLAGFFGGIWLFASLRLFPIPISILQARFTPPLYARMLYGGITEEVLLRWGLMVAFVWLGWRVLQGRRSPVTSTMVWFAITVSAILFGVGHLPVAWFLLGSLTVTLGLFVVALNASFGILFGWLFWRRGLEAAIVAHATTHLVNYSVSALL
jgi:membrane protease YdiL (CAAX protease family)